MKTSVKFNLSSRLWEACDGNGFFFSDSDNKKVMLRALKHDHPEIFRVVHQMCLVVSADGNGKGIPNKFVNRIIKAAQLVAKGKVDAQHLRVHSQNGHNTTYQLSFEGIPKMWKCGCRDFRRARCICDYGQVCKHILAMIILRSMDTIQARRLQL